MAGGLPRTQARRAAVQALYQSLVNNQAPEKDTMDFVMAEYANKIDKNYFQVLVDGVTKEIDTIDAELAHAVDRSLSAVDPVEVSVLRLAVFEYMHRPDIPYRVVLNEAVELAKSFGGEQGHKYVNGVLDKMGARLRQAEYQAAKVSRAQKKSN
ncbi:MULTISPECIES: transcription antitermination factor NusB [unclassified Methylophaga]|jgi:N utilization substance protein B|uniref:transcription antitermination factor NusB n=1 Tax=unclassified Methylophaga TaxID=2629249 RepID=UPI000C90B9C7|nr:MULTISPECIES: transcription antitermination factor NusB [unclassified Methylophaga]MAK66916.1 transcription antitermination factor NusB [Methylophaga sp.]MAY17952.1 transcription antitermination factor NusB [Methylophaga sp.]MBN47162.1 transcription antitermination factor NusB [Methylophaga sp.]HAO25169.1 transcription antitermination factor NusB [Methylophaga sp.]HCD03696.1 transcription antitermination factor NusB [Methylophaga sp.]|tara:strand:- start:6900 stop:7361 length:462 start_codon:yes stop_codon:yes gene_type:complete